MIILNNQDFKVRNDAKTDIEDRGYTFGDGVYEVIRVYNGKFFMLDEHLQRLQFSLNEIAISYDVESEKLQERLEQLLEQNNVVDGAIYLQITRGIAARNHPYPKKSTPELYAYPIPVSRPLEAQQNGIGMTLVQDMRWLRCDIKSLNLLWNVMAKQKAHEQGYKEALFYRDENHVTEGSSSNFFGVKDGKVITHPANNYILNGITRIAILRLCEQLQIPVEERELTLAELEELDEAFIASTTSEVTPVVNIDEHKFNDGTIGEVTKRLQDGFEKLIQL
ncbi:D-amino-acid transaminase [Salinibacillus xinjiangensis]|uniref:D-alanine aminotransferase n=1 Tax=Salinibacillus xinjiangensis TaxID=1229268 RepID=A0A6G1X7Y4_9BACI|nr:D-amino-acid transaminase [Salinibacillus xinjiangensis]MRG87052.1 D-amino-acid transaminase [Salinibacillus xinjiangensis]